MTPSAATRAARPAELAVLAVPADEVLEQARACGAAGVRALVVLSGGFLDGGDEGARGSPSCWRSAAAAGCGSSGPSSLGVLNTDPGVRLNATAAPVAPPPGPVALASQSGAIGVAAIAEAARRGVGLSSFVSTGDKADLSGNDFLQYWEGDDGHARRAALPRVVRQPAPVRHDRPPGGGGEADRGGQERPPRRRAGRRRRRARARCSAPPTSRVDALFEHAGVIRTDTVFEQLDVAALLASQPLPAGGRGRDRLQRRAARRSRARTRARPPAWTPRAPRRPRRGRPRAATTPRRSSASAGDVDALIARVRARARDRRARTSPRALHAAAAGRDDAARAPSWRYGDAELAALGGRRRAALPQPGRGGPRARPRRRATRAGASAPPTARRRWRTSTPTRPPP